MTAPAPGASRRALLEDGSLHLEFAPPLAGAIERWLPLLPPGDPGPAPSGAAALRVVTSPAPSPGPAEGRRTLRLGSMSAWVDDGARHVVLRGDRGAVEGGIDLAGRAAVLRCPHGETEPGATAGELYSALTISSALLLGRLGRALVHAAAVVAPGGGAWLLVGDTHAGKTTTTVNLLNAGWRYVSDDHVVLARGAEPGGVVVEGWPRRFHLDRGWAAGTPGLPREEVDPRERWPGRWLRRAPLAGLLFPRVHAEEPTRLVPHTGADALAALLRQSPWLLADRGAAREVLGLLQRAVDGPAFGVRLGLDTYAGGAPLLAALAALGPRGS